MNRINLVDKYLKELNLENSITNFFKGKKILITGGAGGIGSNLAISVSKLVGKKGLVIVLDNLSSIKKDIPLDFPKLENLLFIKGDIRNNEDLNRVFREKPNIVFHLAAFFANQNSVDYPINSADVDIIGLLKLLDISVISNVSKFIYASSGCSIYGSYGKLPLKEDFMSMHLTTPYQINKMSGEMICNYYLHQFGLNIVKCRFFNSYGPGEVPGQYRNVIPNFIYWSMKRKSIPLTGTGNETRDFTYVLDLVQGLIKSAYYKSAIGESFNLASSKETKIIDLINSINSYTGNNSPIIKLNKRKWDTKSRLRASIDLARKKIYYKPLVKFEKGLKENISWFSKNWDEIEHYADFPIGLNSALRK
tara:strand:- start:531 stop:1622 length:1092 start_codon:yes stop_codon:yes gene_type:complete